ncbi:MAG: sulfite exporter TauE/SafE family protein [Bryobacterales bacterium]|nr:sulfite exporter TauE/SafE family protein [Bryobacterales bacterium]
MPELAAWQWALGALCAFFIGVAKSGIPGLGMVAVPLMILTVGDARASVGWLLPILVVADFSALFFWRRHADPKLLLKLAPWVLVGLSAGSVALGLSERYIRPLIAGIVLVMLAIYLIRRFRPSLLPAALHPAPYGFAGGFSTTVANAAGPVMNLYMLSMNLTKEQFMGNTVWFFLIINLFKLPVYTYHGLLSRNSLTFDAMMVPLVLAGAVTGRWLFLHISQRVFEAFVIVTVVVSTLLLFR